MPSNGGQSFNAIFSIQSEVLTLCGFISPNSAATVELPARSTLGCLRSTVGAATAVLILISTLYPTAMSISKILLVLVTANSTTESKQFGLIEFMEQIPYILINLRAFVVLLEFFLKRHRWTTLSMEASQVFCQLQPPLPYRYYACATARGISWFAFALTAAAAVGWESMNQIDIFVSNPNRTLLSDDVWRPLPIKVHAWQHIIHLALFRLLPFILSQQVYLCAMSLARVVYLRLDQLKRSIAREIAEHTLCADWHWHSHWSNTLAASNSRQIRLLATKQSLAQWEACHFQLLRLTDSVNRHFQWTFLAGFGIDYLTILCMASRMVTGTAHTVLNNVFAVGTMALFGVYIAGSAITFIRVHDTSSQLFKPVGELSTAVGHHNDKDEEQRRLWVGLGRFERICLTNICYCHGFKLVVYTRNFLVQALISTVSFVILAKNVLHKNLSSNP
ncbi:hypothetical protein BV898_05437 [Hypsibius exemplaris]|uniref:Gustatory receptor n=1 Tax=Hypsibius exemplaris TaxID=2072580 RepID=A0A1W0WZM8_HYPEX|nr:hypothetical protein BV898_05437 [Hypsibius exemplaris]